MLALAACAGEHGAVELVGDTMGTRFNVKLPNGLGEHDALGLKQAVEAVLNYDEAQMSTYLRDSDISRFNMNRTIEWQGVERSFCGRTDKDGESGSASQFQFATKYRF